MSMLKETLFTKKFNIKTRNPLSAGMKIMNEASRHGEFVKRNEIYETDGPRSRLELDFEVNEKLDFFTKIKFLFKIHGGTGNRNFLDVFMSGIIETSTKKTGFISETFGRFYKRKLFPSSKKGVKRKLINKRKIFEKIIKKSVLP